MTTERYKLFLELYKEVEEVSHNALMKLYPNVWSGVSPVSFDEETVEFRGHETWSYGGSEYHYESIDTSWFLDETGPALFAKREAEDKRQQELKIIRDQKEEEDRVEKRKQTDLKKLAELKQKYEEPNPD